MKRIIVMTSPLWSIDLRLLGIVLFIYLTYRLLEIIKCTTKVKEV